MPLDGALIRLLSAIVHGGENEWVVKEEQNKEIQAVEHFQWHTQVVHHVSADKMHAKISRSSWLGTQFFSQRLRPQYPLVLEEPPESL